MKPDSSKISQLSALKESVSKNLNLSKDNRNQSFENKLLKIGSRSDMHKESAESKKTEPNVYNDQNDINIFNDSNNNFEASDSKQNRESIENIHSIASNSENEEQGYVNTNNRKQSKDLEIAKSEESKQSDFDENNTKELLEKHQIKIDDNHNDKSYSEEDEEVIQHKLDYKNYIKNLLQDDKNEDNENYKPASLFSNMASKNNIANVPINSVKHSKLNEKLIDYKQDTDDKNNDLFENLNNDCLKMPVILPRVETDVNSLEESDHRLSPKAESDNVPIILENFTDLLDGNKNTHEKVVYFSTLNSQDKAEEHISEIIQENEEQ